MRRSDMRTSERPRLIPDQPETVRARSRKNTKKWCKGVEGRLHSMTVKMWRFQQGVVFMGEPWRYACEECQVCGKILKVRDLKPGEPAPNEVCKPVC